VPVVPNVHIPETVSGNYWHLSSQNEWEDFVPGPVISIDLVRKFLGYVHAFTTVGLEAQAVAYSCGRDGVIKYLVLFPQHNGISSISEEPSSF